MYEKISNLVDFHTKKFDFQIHNDMKNDTEEEKNYCRYDLKLNPKKVGTVPRTGTGTYILQINYFCIGTSYEI